MVSAGNVMISSAGRRVMLLRHFREALASLGINKRVFACDASRRSAGFQSADQAFIVPPCSHPEYSEAIAEICVKNEISVIVPTIDPELPVYAAARSKLSALGVCVLVSDVATVRIGSDKVHTNRWLRESGFPVVRQWIGRESIASDAIFPLVIKPRQGSASVGLRFADDRETLAGLSISGDDVIEEKASGHEHTLDILVLSDGRCATVVPRRRLEVRAGEVSKAVTCRLPELSLLGKRIVEMLPGAYGAINIQVFVWEDSMNVIEINPRFGGGYPLTFRAGADFPKWLLEDAFGLPSTASDSWQADLMMLRFDDAVFVDGRANLG